MSHRTDSEPGTAEEASEEDQVRQHFEQAVDSLQKAVLQLGLARSSLMRAERSVDPGAVQNSTQAQRIRVEAAGREVRAVLVIVKSVSGLP